MRNNRWIVAPDLGDKPADVVRTTTVTTGPFNDLNIPFMRPNTIYVTTDFSQETTKAEVKKNTANDSSTVNGNNTTGNATNSSAVGSDTTAAGSDTTASGGNTTSSGGNGDFNSPLDQFVIKKLLSLDAIDASVSLTNIGLYLTLASLIVLIVFLISNNYNKIVSNSWSATQESVYATLHSIVVNQINEKKGQMYFPFIFTLFIYILSNNLIGMVPYSFASTSHFILTFSLSFMIVLGATFLGFIYHYIKFFCIFVPEGCPLPLVPLLVLIEFISFLARNVSLGLRLAANIKRWD